MNAYEIIEATLNMQKAEVRQRVKDEKGDYLRDSKGRYVYETNPQKTMISDVGEQAAVYFSDYDG